MLSAVLALVGAIVYGAADFFGGLAAKRLRSIVVTAVAAASGLVILGLAFPFIGGRVVIRRCGMGTARPGSSAWSRSRCSMRASQSVR